MGAAHPRPREHPLPHESALYPMPRWPGGNGGTPKSLGHPWLHPTPSLYLRAFDLSLAPEFRLGSESEFAGGRGWALIRLGWGPQVVCGCSRDEQREGPRGEWTEGEGGWSASSRGGSEGHRGLIRGHLHLTRDPPRHNVRPHFLMPLLPQRLPRHVCGIQEADAAWTSCEKARGRNGQSHGGSWGPWPGGQVSVQEG